MHCALCKTKLCDSEGKNCYGENNSIDSIIDNESIKISSDMETEFSMQLTRVEELIMYCKRRNYKKIGIAFCVGLSNEVLTLVKILRSKGFKTYSACCKIGGISKQEIGIKHADIKHDAICNPHLQAQILNESQTDFNIIFGLCIGHDAEFTQSSKAPVSTLVVKDRVLAHNPIGALYSNYYLEKINKTDYL